jgi:serine/threonine protein phosphatase 1
MNIEPGRTIAVGDIHGCSLALKVLLDAINPRPEDTLVPLGDYIDRGPDSRGVLDQIIDLRDRCTVVPLLGNHEEMLLAALSDQRALAGWLACGGTATALSYGWTPSGNRCSLGDLFPEEHLFFLQTCRDFYETETHFFIHAGYVPDLPLDRQPGEALRWRVTDPRSTRPHYSRKVAIVGHTQQRSGEILDLGFLKCIDTNCYHGGWLTALEVRTGQLWQTNESGELR